MYTFLDSLQEIEDGKKTQHEASYDIGMLLRKMYVEKKIDIHSDPNIQKRTRQDNKPRLKKLVMKILRNNKKITKEILYINIYEF